MLCFLKLQYSNFSRARKPRYVSSPRIQNFFNKPNDAFFSVQILPTDAMEGETEGDVVTEFLWPLANKGVPGLVEFYRDVANCSCVHDRSSIKELRRFRRMHLDRYTLYNFYMLAARPCIVKYLRIFLSFFHAIFLLHLK